MKKTANSRIMKMMLGAALTLSATVPGTLMWTKDANAASAHSIQSQMTENQGTAFDNSEDTYDANSVDFTQYIPFDEEVMSDDDSLSAAAGAGASISSATASISSRASSVIAYGKKFKGRPYVFGAKSGQSRNFDCSSFMQYIFKHAGVKLPRNSRQQAKVGKAVSKSHLKAGDVIFADTNRDGVINHVAMYIGNDRLLHTYRKGIGVTVTKFKGTIWDKTFKKARRYL